MGSANVSGPAHYKTKGDSLASMAWARTSVGKTSLVKVGPRTPPKPAMADVMAVELQTKLAALVAHYKR